jgi:hypothetical protein
MIQKTIPMLQIIKISIIIIDRNLLLNYMHIWWSYNSSLWKLSYNGQINYD